LTLEQKRQQKRDYMRDYRAGAGKYKIKEARRKQKERVEALKDKPCNLCGKKYPSYVMDWHHRDPATKEINIGRSKLQNFEKTLAEIEKCVLLCANCHRQVHHGDKEVQE